MNEQEMLAKKKVEQREKTDTILAYILIVILLGCILVVLYLKFIRKEEEVKPVEQEPSVNNTISLDTISNSFNISELVNKYSSEGKTINSTVDGSSIVIDYENGEDNKSYIIPLSSNELVFDVTTGDTVIEEIYKEVAYVICTNLGSDASSCRTAANSISNDTNGIRIVEGDDTKSVYVSIVNSIVTGKEEASEESGTVYTSETIVGLETNNYTLKLDGVTIKGIVVNVNEDNTIKITGTVESEDAIKIIAKIYDEENNIISEKTSDETVNDFEIVFDSIEDIEKVVNYSINVED